MTPPETTELAAAYALDALEPEELAAFEAALAADAELAAEVARFQATVALLGDLADPADEAEPPVDLGGRILTAARSARPPGRSNAPGRDAMSTPAVALAHSTAAFIDAAGAVDAQAWADPTGLGMPVGDLVAHLAGAFDYVAATVGAADDAVPTGLDVVHSTYTQPAMQAARERDPATVTAQAIGSLERLAEWATATGPATFGQLVPYEGAEVPVFLPVVARAFEAWAHGEHLRRATGQPPSTPSAGDLALLCDVAVAAMPVTYARTGHAPAGQRLRLVLVGPGGGTWNVHDGPEPGPEAGAEPPAATVVMEAVDLCRVTGGLVAVTDAFVDIAGDRAFAEALIGSLAVLAE